MTSPEHTRREELGEQFLRDRERLRAVALRILRDPTEADDALQDAFVSACRGIDAFRDESLLSTWLHRIVCNASLMRLRRRRRRPESPLPENGEGLGAAEGRLPDEELARRQLCAEVLRAAEKLDPETLELLVACYLRDEPLQGIARRQRISRGAAKTRLHRARAALRRMMQEGAGGYNAGPGTARPAREAS